MNISNKRESNESFRAYRARLKTINANINDRLKSGVMFFKSFDYAEIKDPVTNVSKQIKVFCKTYRSPKK